MPASILDVIGEPEGKDQMTKTLQKLREDQLGESLFSHFPGSFRHNIFRHIAVNTVLHAS